MSALLFAVHIVYVSKFSGTNDVLVLTVMQFFIGGACGVACGACFETLSPAWALTPEFFFSVLLYGEQVGLKLIVGFVLIFGAILVSEMFPLKRKDVATNQLEAVPVELP